MLFTDMQNNVDKIIKNTPIVKSKYLDFLENKTSTPIKTKIVSPTTVTDYFTQPENSAF